MEITHLLAGTMIYLGDKATDIAEGIKMSHDAIENGSAFQKWLDIVEEQGGNTDVIKNPEQYPEVKFKVEVPSTKSGVITQMDTYAMGMISLELGAGRRSKNDDVDPQAGFLLHKKIGTEIKRNETFATLYTNKEDKIEAAVKSLQSAMSVSDRLENQLKAITHRVDKNGIHEYQ
jgi:pyrimidine-nucleoside phosphorylase